MQTSDSERRDDDDGFVLIVVAGVLLLLALVASSLMLATRTELKALSQRKLHAESAALADGLVNITGYRLARQRGSTDGIQRIIADGSPILCRENDLISELRVYDTAGLIDINVTPPEVLRILLKGIGLTAEQSDALARAIEDFRSPDLKVAFGGPTAAEYAMAGLSHGPKKAPFQSVSELDQVIGFTPDLLARLRPFLTVHSRSAAIDPTVSPIELLRALARGSSSWDGDKVNELPREQIQIPAQVSRRAASRGSRTRLPVMITRVRVSGPGGTQIVREATIELSTQSKNGFYVWEWATPPVPSEPIVSKMRAVELPPCIGPG